MTAMDDLLSRLDPKVAKQIKMAQETELIRYPLASVGLTNALNGGVGAGRAAVIYGNTSCGKSLVCMQSVGLWQEMGLSCAWFDAEGTYEKSFGAQLGIDNSQLILKQHRSFGKITDEAVPLLKAGLDIMVIDSISDIMPDVFLDKGDLKNYENMKQIGAHAKGNTAMLNALHYANERTAIILISQTTTQIEAMYTKQVPHGGKKLEFSVSQMIKLTSSNTDAKQIKGLLPVGDKLIEQPIGRRVDAFVEKNKLGRQHTRASYDMYYAGPNLGIDNIGEVVDLGIEYGAIDKAGAWFSGFGVRTQGRDEFVKAVKGSDELYEKIKNEIELKRTGVVA